MEKFKVLLLALAVGIIFIPLSFYLKKFTTIEAYEKPTVRFDPITCYECTDCPCKVTLDNGKSYNLNRKDKGLCEMPSDIVTKSLRRGISDYTAHMDLSEYKTFSECVKWYSLHPTY